MNKKMMMLGLLLSATLMLNGCSAVMAAKGTKPTDITTIKKGDDAGTVAAKIGHAPVKKYNQGGYYYEVYEVLKGEAPSAGRAIAHGAMDFLTLGLWEVAGTPIEMSSKDKTYVLIKYANNQLVSVEKINDVPKVK